MKNDTKTLLCITLLFWVLGCACIIGVETETDCTFLKSVMIAIISFALGGFAAGLMISDKD